MRHGPGELQLFPERLVRRFSVVDAVWSGEVVIAPIQLRPTRLDIGMLDALVLDMPIELGLEVSLV